jgi:hypothetical protein
MENLEQYDTADPGDLFVLMDFMEKLIASAKRTDKKLTPAA